MQVIFTKWYVITLNIISFFINICLQEEKTLVASVVLLVFQWHHWSLSTDAFATQTRNWKSMLLLLAHFYLHQSVRKPLF